MIINKAYLEKLLRNENINAITRNNDVIISDCIETAEAETKAYLCKYNTDNLFANPDEFLKRLVANIAIWHILTISNANIETAIRSKKYDESIQILTKIQKGIMSPHGWSLASCKPSSPSNVSGTTFSAFFNPKRQNQF